MSRKKTSLRQRFFEGYCLKSNVDDVPLSIHVISSDCFDIISKCFVADVRVYRPSAKSRTYRLYGFDRCFYDYFIKNIPLKDLNGVRTIVPVSFINNDRYFIGVYRDKLLSNPEILFEREGYVSQKLDKLWWVIVENLYCESMRIHQKMDLNIMNVQNALAKRDKFSAEAIALIKEKTTFYLSRIR